MFASHSLYSTSAAEDFSSCERIVWLYVEYNLVPFLSAAKENVLLRLCLDMARH
jgi:hypothetical protein